MYFGLLLLRFKYIHFLSFFILNAIPFLQNHYFLNFWQRNQLFSSFFYKFKIIFSANLIKGKADAN